MSLVQIAASIENGAYYYDLTSGQIYRVPHEDLLELNNVRFTNVIGGLIGGILVVMGILSYAKNLRYGDSPLALRLLLVVWVLSSCLFCWLVKNNQKRISRLIRDRYRALHEVLSLRQVVKQGRKAYIQLSVYCVFLFFFAIVSLSISVTSASALYALFSIVFFDTGVMVITILQPFGKIIAYSSIRKKYNRDNRNTKSGS